MRVAVTGMGGDIGTGVALRLDLDPTIDLMYPNVLVAVLHAFDRHAATVWGEHRVADPLLRRTERTEPDFP